MPSRVFGFLACALLSGCTGGDSQHAVVVYSALDPEFSEPILQDAASKIGFEVRAKFDVESTKTVGLTQAIMAESRRPRCDVFWNNEILNTLRLERQGLLEPYRSPIGQQYPQQWRSPEGAWYGFAARARILLVNTELVAEGDRPDSIYDLAAPPWKGRAAIAKPLFGTTASHAACLFAALGEDAAKSYFRDLKANDVQVLAGNKQVAQAVSAGRAAFGLTDTDDAIVEIEAGRPVAIVYPDQGAEGLGTLFIPNTLAIIKGGPNPVGARRLVDHLLEPQIEARLAAGPSAQIPLHPAVSARPRVETPASVKPMEVDFAAAADQWDAAARFIREEFAAAE